MLFVMIIYVLFNKGKGQELPRQEIRRLPKMQTDKNGDGVPRDHMSSINAHIPWNDSYPIPRSSWVFCGSSEKR